MAINLLYFLFFPGLLFAAITGGFLSWFDRKITARIQFRKGPPVLQPFYDFFKLLLVKETILPKRGSPVIFLLAPVFALFGATMACVFILLPLLNITTGFKGDLIVIFYTDHSLIFLYSWVTGIRESPRGRWRFKGNETDPEL